MDSQHNHGQNRGETPFQARLSRAQMLVAAGAGALLASIPAAAAADSGASGERASAFEAPYYPQVTSGSYTPESPQEIIKNLITLRVFDLTVTVPVLNNPATLARVGLTGPALTITQALVAAEQYQLDWLQSIAPGITPLTTTFTVDTTTLSDTKVFLAASLFLANLYIAADLAATREFAELGMPSLSKNMAQMAIADAEGLTAFRTMLSLANVPGTNPPNNKAFETENLLYTRDAVAMLKILGFIGGAGAPFTYPGRDAVLAATGAGGAALIQRTPNNAAGSVPFTGLATFAGQR